MKYIKILRTDIKQGIFASRWMLFSPLVIGLLVIFDFFIRLDFFKEENLKDVFVTWGDLLLYMYGGMKEYIPMKGEPFIFPAVWIMSFSLAAVCVLNYPFADMQYFGTQMMVRAGGRKIWWLSKCMWNVLGTLYFHFVLFILTLIACLVKGLPLNTDIHMVFVSRLFELKYTTGYRTASYIPVGVCILTVFIFITINLVQMSLSLYIRPVFSFLLILVYMIMSAYYLNPYMAGNYAMMLRGNWIYEGGIPIWHGYVLSIILVVVSVIAGLVRFDRFYDIINRE